MKRIISIMLLVCVGSVFAGYTYEIGPGQDFGDLTLYSHETLLMTSGMGHYLDVHFWSSARIEDTAPLVSEGNGGIWQLTLGDYSVSEILGGDIHEVAVGSDAYVTISGGRIDEIGSRQFVGVRWIEGTDPPEYEPDTHIEIICRDWLYTPSTKKLTGTWKDFSTFNIQLVDYAGYDTTIDNIEFTIIPEPASLLLLAVGGLILRKRRS